MNILAKDFSLKERFELYIMKLNTPVGPMVFKYFLKNPKR